MKITSINYLNVGLSTRWNINVKKLNMFFFNNYFLFLNLKFKNYLTYNVYFRYKDLTNIKDKFKTEITNFDGTKMPLEFNRNIDFYYWKKRCKGAFISNEKIYERRNFFVIFYFFNYSLTSYQHTALRLFRMDDTLLSAAYWFEKKKRKEEEAEEIFWKNKKIFLNYNIFLDVKKFFLRKFYYYYFFFLIKCYSYKKIKYFIFKNQNFKNKILKARKYSNLKVVESTWIKNKWFYWCALIRLIYNKHYALFFIKEGELEGYTSFVNYFFLPKKKLNDKSIPLLYSLSLFNFFSKKWQNARKNYLLILKKKQQRQRKRRAFIKKYLKKLVKNEQVVFYSRQRSYRAMQYRRFYKKFKKDSRLRIKHWISLYYCFLSYKKILLYVNQLSLFVEKDLGFTATNLVLTRVLFNKINFIDKKQQKQQRKQKRYKKLTRNERLLELLNENILRSYYLVTRRVRRQLLYIFLKNKFFLKNILLNFVFTKSKITLFSPSFHVKLNTTLKVKGPTPLSKLDFVGMLLNKHILRSVFIKNYWALVSTFNLCFKSCDVDGLMQLFKYYLEEDPQSFSLLQALHVVIPQLVALYHHNTFGLFFKINGRLYSWTRSRSRIILNVGDYTTKGLGMQLKGNSRTVYSQSIAIMKNGSVSLRLWLVK